MLFLAGRKSVVPLWAEGTEVFPDSSCDYLRALQVNFPIPHVFASQYYSYVPHIRVHLEAL